MNSFPQLEEKINHAKSLDFGDIISASIDLFKHVWLKGFLAILFLMIGGFVIAFTFSLIGLAPENYLFENGFEMESFLTFYSANALYSVPQSILASTLTIAFLSAFYRICKNFVLGKDEGDDYFYFFKKEYFSKVFMLGLIYTGISTLAQLLFLIPYIYVLVPLSYFSIIFANNPNLTEGEIVKASFKLGNKKWLITFGAMFVTGILGMLGLLACGIGLFFTISIACLPVFFIYKEVIGFEEIHEIDQIGMGDESNY
ncbi:hypothetical protein [Hwangdonia sp.]|uniref:hypothetical protein n=1 Tax=Hwangdonia sp. TaxID=1883432 RepID=UPI003AB70229